MYQATDELFDELDTLDGLSQSDEFEEEGLDSAVGERIGINTTDIESRIAEHMRHQRPSIQEVHMHSTHPVGRVPVQGINPGDINVQFPGRRTPTTSSQPDVSFVGADRNRVNLEVDARHNRSVAHQQAHLQAMQAAVRHAGDGNREIQGMTRRDVVEQTRSVFVETDSRGRVTQIRKVGYRVDDRGRVTEDRTRSETIDLSNNPQNLQNVLRSGVLESRANTQYRPSATLQNQRTAQGRPQQHPLQEPRSPQSRVAQHSPHRPLQGARSSQGRPQQRPMRGQRSSQSHPQQRRPTRGQRSFDAFAAFF